MRDTHVKQSAPRSSLTENRRSTTGLNSRRGTSWGPHTSYLLEKWLWGTRSHLSRVGCSIRHTSTHHPHAYFNCIHASVVPQHRLSLSFQPTQVIFSHTHFFQGYLPKFLHLCSLEYASSSTKVSLPSYASFFFRSFPFYTDFLSSSCPSPEHFLSPLSFTHKNTHRTCLQSYHVDLWHMHD